jgi:hypothetical protein
MTKKDVKMIRGESGHLFTEEEYKIINEQMEEYRKKEREVLMQQEVNARVNKRQW